MHKLSKKQQKSKSFRQRVAQPQSSIPGTEPGPLPEQEQEPENHDPEPEPSAAKKRKEHPHDHKPAVKRRRVQSAEQSGDKPTDADTSGAASDASAARLILFVGNLRFATTKETIAQHFSKCTPAPTIRLLTNKDTGKSKGCAFVEFKTSGSLQEGLGLHHTIVDGRKINVELTAGGGGKSVMRQTRIKNRNAELEKQRDKRAKEGKKPSKKPQKQTGSRDLPDVDS